MSLTFILLSFLMGAVVLISNYLVQFPFNHFGLNEILTYGAFSYPIAFLITDLSNRYYGKIIAKNIETYINATIHQGIIEPRGTLPNIKSTPDINKRVASKFLILKAL